MSDFGDKMESSSPPRLQQINEQQSNRFPLHLDQWPQSNPSASPSNLPNQALNPTDRDMHPDMWLDNSVVSSSVVTPSESESGASTNSWVDGSDVESTESDSKGAEDMDTPNLPILSVDEKKTYQRMESSKLAPIRDEVDGVYRCHRCAFEVDHGECTGCLTHYEGYIIDEGYPLREVDSERLLEHHHEFNNEDVDSHITHKGKSRVTPNQRDLEAHSLDVERPISKDLYIDDTEVPNQRDIESSSSVLDTWLRRLKPRLKRLSQNTLSQANNFLTSTSEKDNLELTRETYKTDKKAITGLRLERWGHELFKIQMKQQYEEMRETIETLKREIRGLKGEL
ncbi:hypothetical protein BT63DRAFT_450204 [Microthyrium microscopicum]|uniref:Uncharacterized protein n=1 Tax=Microthyrium microscopicum TaxID=703497 RepID=A0A6A6UVW8_9PEZI|nr:hypothetical protein BT63DRAFT_450204 [Microthyrium microscopicum]